MRSWSERADPGRCRNAAPGGPCYPRAFNHALTSCLYQIGVRGTLPGDDTLKPMMPAVPLLAAGAASVPDPAERRPGSWRAGARSGRLTHLEHVPAAAGPPGRLAGLGRRRRSPRRSRPSGVPGPWAHQAAAADHAAAGRNVIISTGPASGKSLGYLLPALTRVLGRRHRAVPRADPGARRRPAADGAARSASPASARRWWTATRRPASGPGPGRTRPTCSPPRTCCTTRCCRGTPAGTGSSGACRT